MTEPEKPLLDRETREALVRVIREEAKRQSDLLMTKAPEFAVALMVLPNNDLIDFIKRAPLSRQAVYLSFDCMVQTLVEGESDDSFEVRHLRAWKVVEMMRQQPQEALDRILDSAMTVHTLIFYRGGLELYKPSPEWPERPQGGGDSGADPDCKPS